MYRLGGFEAHVPVQSVDILHVKNTRLREVLLTWERNLWSTTLGRIENVVEYKKLFIKFLLFCRVVSLLLLFMCLLAIRQKTSVEESSESSFCCSCSCVFNVYMNDVVSLLRTRKNVHGLLLLRMSLFMSCSPLVWNSFKVVWDSGWLACLSWIARERYCNDVILYE